MIYLHFNMLIIKNTELLIGSESIITCLHNTLSQIPCIHEFHWLGGKKGIKGFYNSRKSVQHPFMKTKLNFYLTTQFTICHFLDANENWKTRWSNIKKSKKMK